MGEFVIHPNEDDEIATCSCCAGMPGVRGFVYQGEEALAVYFAEPSGMVNFPMLRLGLVVGRWAGDTMASDRVSLAFSCRQGPVIEPIDPHLPTFPEMAFLGVQLMGKDLPSHKDAAKFRAIAEAVVADDPRLSEMRAAAPATKHRRFVADAPPGDAG